MNYKALNEILSHISTQTRLEREELDEWEIASNARHNKEIVLLIGLSKSGKVFFSADCELIDNKILKDTMTFNTYTRDNGCDKLFYERASHLGFDYEIMRKMAMLLRGKGKFPND